MDLAYLNAGAGKIDGEYIEDVDVNYDDAIDMNDLQVMFDQWGKSLHAEIEYEIQSDLFLGSNGTGTIRLEEIVIADQGIFYNSSFISQNNLENSVLDFASPLADPGGGIYSDPDLLGDHNGIYDSADDAADPV